jgi:hypothetical protein
VVLGSLQTPTADAQADGRFVVGVAVLQDRMPSSAPLSPRRTEAASRASQPPPPSTILLADEFNDAANGVLPVESPTPQRAARGYFEGEYVIVQNDPGMERSPISVLPGTYSDTRMAVDARLVGPTDGRVLMVGCRDAPESNSHYRFAIRPDIGHFELIRWYGLERVPLVEWDPSSAIRLGNAANRLELTCDGPTISASINDVPVGAVQDSSYPSGGLWVGAGTLESQPATVDGRFDNLVVIQE